MPMYGYKCEKCTKEIEVVRSVVQSDDPPTREEAGEECEHKWNRHFTTAPRTIRMPGWGAGKGNWTKDW